MSLTAQSRSRSHFAPIVLLAAVLFCALILWGGPRLAAWAISEIASEAQPSGAEDETIASIIIFGLLLIGGLVGGALCGINAARPGSNGGLRLAQGLGIGVAGLLMSAALARIAGAVRPLHGGTSAGLLLWGTAVIILQSGSEEIFFRGWLQPILVRAWGWAGILVTAIAFALLHRIGAAASAASVANMFLGGLLFGILAARYGGIASAFGAHFAWNWAEQLLFGLDPNPGDGSFGSILNLDLVGSPLWGGSPEGLNASVAMTFALAVLIAPILIVRPGARQPPELHQSGRAPV